MTIEELNKLIKEELDAYLSEEEDDDIEVTTDEPAADTGEEAMDLLKQIYNMLKPQVEPEEEDDEEEMADEPADEEGKEGDDEGEDEGDDEDLEENLDRPNYKAEDIKDVRHDAEKIKGGLNESFDGAARFKKLANIKG